jgi:hypothetical protein
MLHQIALYQLIPKMRETIHGCITETQCNLADAEEDRRRVKQEKREGTPTDHRARESSIKLRHRLKQCQQTLKVLTDLQRSLNE